MPTNEERRDIARRLREAAGHYEIMECDVDFYPVASALGLKPTGETTYTPESVRSLADLIEPKRACYYYDSETNRCGCHDTRLVDRDALLKLADELESEGLEGWASGSVNVGEFARRIREALGVAR